MPSFSPTFITHPLPSLPTFCNRVPFRCAALPPKRIGAVAKDLQQALQTALQARTSRISIKLPVGAKLGTEIRSDDEDLFQRRKAGDRELARLLAGMFEGTGLSIRVLFMNRKEKDMTGKMWGTKTECEIADIGDKAGKKKKKKIKSAGFGKAETSENEEKVDVYIVAGGGGSSLNGMRALAEQSGMETLIIIANGNSEGDSLPVDLQRFWEREFEVVYHYEPNPHPRWKGGVLFRKFPGEWVLCRLSGLRLLQQLFVSKERPTMDCVGQALQAEEEKAGDSVLNKISTFIDRNIS